MGKRARKKRRAEGIQRPSRGAARRAAKELSGRLGALLARADEPGAGPSTVAAEWLALLGTGPYPDLSSELLFRAVGRDRAEAIADALVSQADGGLGPLLLRAEVAALAGDDVTAVSVYEAALDLDDRPVTRWCYALSLQGCGRLADSIEVLEDILRADPGDEAAHDVYRDVLRDIDERSESGAEDEPCPCGSGVAYELCCLPRERASLVRFGDRRVFDELREELAHYLSRDEFQDLGAEALRVWLGLEDEGGAKRPILDPREAQLFTEWALAAGLVPIDDDPDVTTSLLDRFAGDPATSSDSARRALAWHEHCHFGLWVVENPAGEPAVGVREILTRRRMWVEVPPTLREGMARWEVLLGYTVPVDGIWRIGGSFLTLTPAIGDEVARAALEAVEVVLLGMIREQQGKAPEALLPDEMFDLPLSLQASYDDPSPIPSEIMSGIVKQAFPSLVREAREKNRRPVTLQNTDGESTELITARIELGDPVGFRRQVSAHPDFDVHDDEIAWHGRELTAFERVQQAAVLRDQGIEPEADEPGHWVKARLAWDDDRLVADVNSRERLNGLMDLLEVLAGGASIKEETTIDPAQDFVLPTTSAVPLRDVSPSEDEAWRGAWVDEPLPALDGMTPREAGRSRRGRVLLEAMMRYFEYEADRARLAGLTPRDTEALREAVGLDRHWTYLERSE